jgi:hypothetical protein
MSISGSSEINSKPSHGKSEGGFLGLLRTVVLIVVVIGAGGSVGLMLREGQRSPSPAGSFLILVLSPFVALLWANMVSKRWSVVTRHALQCDVYSRAGIFVHLQ